MGKTVKALGTHCYLGGFLIGLQRAGLDVVGSLETWKQGMNGARILGLPSQEFPKKPRLKEIKSNIIVGNPPCSRFSHLSLSFFKKEDHENIETFPEILNLSQVARETKAGTIWWETGPLAWSLGEPLLYNFHKHLKKFWGEVATLIVRIDLRSIGIPQKRPRTHIIHRATKSPPPGCSRPIWPPTKRVGEWVGQKTKGFKLENPVFQNKSKNPVEWAKKKSSELTFRSMVPKIFSKNDWYTTAVVSRRLMIWKEENRWFDLLEHASLMTYPLEQIPKLLKVAKTSLGAQVLISKSVAPKITEWVAREIVLPWIRNEKKDGEIKPTLRRQGIWKLDLRISPKMEKALLSGQKTLL